MYYAFALRTGSPHRTSCVMYYVLCIMYYVFTIMYYALPLGVHIVCYVCVLRITYYVLRTGGGGVLHMFWWSSLLKFMTWVSEVPGPQSVGGSEICSRVSVEAVWERARRSCVGSVG